MSDRETSVLCPLCDEVLEAGMVTCPSCGADIPAANAGADASADADANAGANAGANADENTNAPADTTEPKPRKPSTPSVPGVFDFM